MKIKEHYLIFKGDDIAGSETSLKDAKKAYNALPSKDSMLDGRSIYKLIKQE
tara:strand:+ start:14251 stop:14406 length:156 start_codon:yes stop_codon:yes gene_type:complete